MDIGIKRRSLTDRISVGMPRRPCYLLLALIGIGIIAGPGPSYADEATPGSLFQTQCLYTQTESNTIDNCESTPGLNGVNSGVFASDGKHFYTASWIDDTITAFDVDTTSGELERIPEGCMAGSLACSAASGLDGVRSLDIVDTASGKSFLYAASVDSDSLTAFEVEPDGSLEQVVDSCRAGSELCGPANGVDYPTAVKVSPDGRYLYVAAEDSSTITAYTINQETGKLTQLSSGGCSDATGGSCDQEDGLLYVTHVTVSPDGRFAYAASWASDTITAFEIDGESGELTQLTGGGCKDSAGGPCNAEDGLSQASSVTVEPEGKFAYATARDNDFPPTVTVYTIKTDGSLAQIEGGCSSGDDTPCDMNGALSIAISPEGGQAYVASGLDHSLLAFDRDKAAGTLKLMPDGGCFVGTNFCDLTNGSYGASGVTVSPDGRHVYLTSQWGNAISVYSVRPKSSSGDGNEPPPDQGGDYDQPKEDTSKDSGGSSGRDSTDTVCSAPPQLETWLKVPKTIRNRRLVSKRAVGFKARSSVTAKGKAQLVVRTRSRLGRKGKAKLVTSKAITLSSGETKYRIRLSGHKRAKLRKLLRESGKKAKVVSVEVRIVAKANFGTQALKQVAAASYRGRANKAKRRGPAVVTSRKSGVPGCVRKFRVALSSPKKVKAGNLVKPKLRPGRGIKVRVRCSSGCEGQVRLTLTRRSAKALRIRGKRRSKPVARVSFTLIAEESKKLRLRPAQRSLLRRLRRGLRSRKGSLKRLKATLELTATAHDGQVGKVKRPVKIKLHRS